MDDVVISNPYMLVWFIVWVISWMFFIGALCWILRDRKPTGKNWKDLYIAGIDPYTEDRSKWKVLIWPKAKLKVGGEPAEFWEDYHQTRTEINERLEDVFCWSSVVFACITLAGSFIFRIIESACV